MEMGSAVISTSTSPYSLLLQASLDLVEYQDTEMQGSLSLKEISKQLKSFLSARETIQIKKCNTRKLLRGYWKILKKGQLLLDPKKLDNYCTIISHLLQNLHALQDEQMQLIREIGYFFLDKLDISQVIEDDYAEYLSIQKQCQIHFTQLIKLCEENKLRIINFQYLEALKQNKQLSQVEYLYYYYLNLADSSLRVRGKFCALSLLRRLSCELGRFISYCSLEDTVCKNMT